MAKSMKRAAATKKLPAKKPIPKGHDLTSSATGLTIFDRADAGNRRLGKTKRA